MRSFTDIFRDHAVFDVAGRHIGGTDKQSNHNYGPAYDAIFPHTTRAAAKFVLEIGVADGSSMLAFREAFPTATVVGLDIIAPARVAGQTDRLEFYLGSQFSQLACLSAVGEREFDVVVEDATHELDANLLTLFWLWPSVKPGGVYVVEEFANVGAYRREIEAMFPFAEIVDTPGPFGGIEPLVVLRKPK